MPSILSNNPVQTTEQQNPVSAIKNLASQILSSVNPQETFNQILANNEQAKSAMDKINQYGNGDPRAAFMNYMKCTGQQNLGQQIIQKLGLS